ncbi:hypothetical protein JXA84_09095 [candidate division WOR-3 bacterium]|nr:hypothetical protein [candidate division WOR-3 bacterium]
MKRFMMILFVLLIFALGAVSGFIFSLVKFNSAEKVIIMDVGNALPLKAEQAISSLKSYISLWRGRLEIIESFGLSDSSILSSLKYVEPVDVEGVMISDSLSTRYYPDSLVFDVENTDYNFHFRLSPFYVSYSRGNKISILIDENVLEKRIALQALSSSATPFTTVVFYQNEKVFASEEEFECDFDSIYLSSDTGSVWDEDEAAGKFWKNFQIENVPLTIVIYYDKEKTK